MKVIIALFTVFLLLGNSLFAQNSISGKVLDTKGNPLAGANVFLEGTYDGTTTNNNGEFNFLTTKTGIQKLVVSFLSYSDFSKFDQVDAFVNLNVILKENVSSLDAVIISAGTFEAGENSRVSVLKPLDIVTTAGSAGDIVAALQTLPGTQLVGENGRLFVRGGEAGETQTFVDGLRVAQPYNASVQNIPARGRFSPFLFNGISFSTGGYGAEFGEALSSILQLNTENVATQDKTDVSLMTVGLGIGHTQALDKSSFSFNTSYINLTPYLLAIPQNLTWNKAFESISGEGIYRKDVSNGIWKIYAAFDASNFDLNQENINSPQPLRLDLKNNNFYLNSSYAGIIGNTWQVFTGISYGRSTNNAGLDSINIADKEHATHIKGKISKKITPGLKISIGAEYFNIKYRENLQASENKFIYDYSTQMGATFTQASILFSKNFAANLGLRASYNTTLKEPNLSPRLSMAYKTGETSQFSMAYGQFIQSPGNEFLKFSSDFSSQKATHYILNYQYNKNRKLFRAEVYLKDYKNLIKYNTSQVVPTSIFTNIGNGYAKGIDLFWRDGKSIKNMEYWVSYSFIDSKRNYRDFPQMATPNFIATHTASLVTKYWVQDLRSQVGFSHNYSSGRPFNNPNEARFMNGKTRDFNSLNFNWAYLISQQKILYFSVSNILGTENIFGYEYSKNPNDAGIYNRRVITPTANRFFFIGFFWTLSEDKNKNQLENL